MPSSSLRLVAPATHASAPVVFMCTPRSPRRVAYHVVRALVDMVA
eukprot:COSAG01_NODE_73326_length_248_cov_2.147651_1_plen_44_part_01